jgi:uncharacterized Ntn-hydrolase superfamily protein
MTMMRRTYRALFVLLVLIAGLGSSLPGRRLSTQPEVRASTFSIVAYDADRKEWGVATASRIIAVGCCVPWAKADTGAIATQSAVNVSYGPKGLELLAGGKSAAEVIKTLTDADNGRQSRQLAVIDKEGRVASFTGKGCIPWAGGKEGKHYACVGNLLTGEAVIADMAKTFEEAKGPLAWRLVLALEAGEKAGGDKRGKQSAAVLVVREGAGINGFGDRYIDLRVDDHETPVQELARILGKRIGKPR